MTQKEIDIMTFAVGQGYVWLAKDGGNNPKLFTKTYAYSAKPERIGERWKRPPNRGGKNARRYCRILPQPFNWLSIDDGVIFIPALLKLIKPKEG